MDRDVSHCRGWSYEMRSCQENCFRLTFRLWATSSILSASMPLDRYDQGVTGLA